MEIIPQQKYSADIKDSSESRSHRNLVTEGLLCFSNVLETTGALKRHILRLPTNPWPWRYQQASSNEVWISHGESREALGWGPHPHGPFWMLSVVTYQPLQSMNRVTCKLSPKLKHCSSERQHCQSLAWNSSCKPDCYQANWGEGSPWFGTNSPPQQKIVRKNKQFADMYSYPGKISICLCESLLF